MNPYILKLCSDANDRLRYNNPGRAREIEWFVTSSGELALRDIPEFSAERTKRCDERLEAERQRWLANHRGTSVCSFADVDDEPFE